MTETRQGIEQINEHIGPGEFVVLHQQKSPQMTEKHSQCGQPPDQIQFVKSHLLLGLRLNLPFGDHAALFGHLIFPRLHSTHVRQASQIMGHIRTVININTAKLHKLIGGSLDLLMDGIASIRANDLWMVIH